MGNVLQEAQKRALSRTHLSTVNCRVARDLVILGSGLNDEAILDAHLAHYWRETEFPFSAFDINVPAKNDHPGTFVLSYWNGVPVVVSRGRVHRYQVPTTQRELRNWMAAGMVLMGAGRRIIITNAVGGLTTEMTIGSIALPTEFIAWHFSCEGYVDGWSDGHPAPEGLLPQLDDPFIVKTRNYAREVDLKVSWPNARYIVVPGPRFGGRGERFLFGEIFRCQTVGMSLLPELDLIAVENMTNPDRSPLLRVGAIQVVSDNQDHPNDADVVAEVRKAAPKIGELIGKLLNDKSW